MRHHLLCGWLALVSHQFVTSFAFGFGAVASQPSSQSIERADAVKSRTIADNGAGVV
jgi:hypothetical protein